MRASFIALLVFLTVASWASEGVKPPKSYEGRGHPTINFQKPDLTDSDEQVTWRMWYIAKGTRSEGLHGAILLERKPIEGGKIGDKKEVNGKVYVWCGDWDSRRSLFSLSGWLPRSEDRVSRWLANTIKAEQGGAEQPATAPESKPAGEKKIKPESEGHSK